MKGVFKAGEFWYVESQSPKAEKILIPFLYAELCTTGRRWYIVFSVRNQQQEMKRYRYYVSMSIPKKKRIEVSNRYAKYLNTLIDRGWNPEFNGHFHFADFLHMCQNRKKNQKRELEVINI